MSLYNFRKAQLAAILSNYPYTKPNKPPEGFKVVAHHKNGQTGYIGIAYYNNITEEVYIICGASKKLKNRQYAQFNLNYLPVQLEDAENFYQLTLTLTQHLSVSEYILGGHALQGGIQQLIGAKHTLVTYTFQAPGMGLIAPQFNVDPTKKYPHLYNIRSLSDSVTLSGNQLGTVILTDIPTGHALTNFNDYIIHHTYSACAIHSKVWNTGKNLLLEAIPINQGNNSGLIDCFPMFENAGMVMSYAWAEVLHQLDPQFMPEGVNLQHAFRNYPGNLEHLSTRLNILVEQTPLHFDNLFTQVIAKLLLENTLLTAALLGDKKEEVIKNFIQFFDCISYYPMISDLVAENTCRSTQANFMQLNETRADFFSVYPLNFDLNDQEDSFSTPSILRHTSNNLHYFPQNDSLDQKNLNTTYGEKAIKQIFSLMKKNYYQEEINYLEFNPNLLPLNLKGSGRVSNLATAATMCPYLTQLAFDLMELTDLNYIKLQVETLLQVWANTAAPLNEKYIRIQNLPIIFYASNLDFNVRPYLAIAAAEAPKRSELCQYLNKTEQNRAREVYQFHDEFLQKVLVVEAFSGTPLFKMTEHGMVIGHYDRQDSTYVTNTDGKQYHYFSITSFVIASLELAYNTLVETVTNQILHTNLIRPYLQSIDLKINDLSGNYQIDLTLFKQLLQDQPLETFLYHTALLTKYAGTELMEAGWNGWEILTEHETKINRNKGLLHKLKELNFIF